MRRPLALAVPLLLGALVGAACADDPGSDPADAPTTTTAGG